MTKKFWKWPSIIRQKEAALIASRKAQDDLDSGLRDMRGRMESAHAVAMQFQEACTKAKLDLEQEHQQYTEVASKLEEIRREMEVARTEAANTMTDLLRSNLETEKAKAELEKVRATLERADLATQTEKLEHGKTKRMQVLLTEWIFKTHHLVIPPAANSLRALFTAGKNRLSVVLFLLLPMMLFAAPPTPLLRSPFTTNEPAWSQTNVISLSTTNATSKPLTNHYQDGVLTLFGLEAGVNITLTHNGSNIVITGSGGAGDAGGTNARQFGTLVLTNLSNTGAVTNVVSLSTTNATSKPITNHFEDGILTLYGLEQGSNTVLFVNGSNIVINSSEGGASSPLLVSNVTLVAKNGNDGTGVPGNLSLPFLTISNAVQASPAGFTVVVEPGNYNESVLLKNLVNLNMPSGVVVSQSVTTLPVILDGGTTSTNRLYGDFGIVHTASSASTAHGFFITGANSDIVVNKATVRIYSSGAAGFRKNSGTGPVKFTGEIYSNSDGYNSQGGGNTEFRGRIYSTNNYALLIGAGASNYVSGEFLCINNSALHFSGAGFVLVENSEATSFNFDFGWGLEQSGGDVEVRQSVLRSAVQEAIGKYGGNLLVLDDVQLFATNTLFSIDNDGDPTHGSIQIRGNCWANRPANPAMNITQGGVTVTNVFMFKEQHALASVHNLTNIITRTNGVVAFPSTPASGDWGALDSIGNLFRTNLPSVLSNLISTAANNVTNVVSLSTTNSTSKPITNHYENGVLTLFGLEQGANITLSQNGSNIVITGSAGGGTNTLYMSNTVSIATAGTLNFIEGTNVVIRATNDTGRVDVEISAAAGTGGLTTNDNQFLGVPLSVRAGALLTNIVIQQSNNTSVSLLVTNNPGSVVNLMEAYNTNRAGFVVRSNGVIDMRANVVSGTNQTMIWDNLGASGQTYLEIRNGGIASFVQRGDSSGNAVFSSMGVGDFYFNYDGGSGNIHWGVPAVGDVMRFIGSSDVYALHGQTTRRLQLTNVWDIFCRSNMTWIEVGGSDTVSIQSTSGMSSYTMFLPITNALAGQVLYMPVPGQLAWKDDAVGGGGALFNPDQFLPSATHTNIKAGAFLTNMNYWGLGTNYGQLWVDEALSPLADDTYFLGQNANAWNLLYVKGNGVRFKETGGGLNYVQIMAPLSLAANYDLSLPDAQGADGQVITNNGAGLLGWWTPVSSGGGLTTNANQFGAQVILTIKEGAQLTNTLFWQSNTTGPATISTMTIGAITNVAEWRQSNGTPVVTINSNAQLSFGPENIKTAIAFRTNQIDLSTYQWKPFTNSLQTNIVLQITNLTEGVQTTLDIYGAGIFGGTVTNAWNVLLTASAGTTIKWPVGATNGNFDVLVNSNQVVQINLWASRRTNVLASYKAFE